MLSFQVIVFALPHAPSIVHKVGITPTTADNEKEFIEILIEGGLRYVYSRADRSLYFNVTNEAPHQDEQAKTNYSLVNYSSDDESGSENMVTENIQPVQHDEGGSAKAEDEQPDENNGAGSETGEGGAEPEGDQPDDDDEHVSEVDCSSSTASFSDRDQDKEEKEEEEVISVDPSQIEGCKAFYCQGWRKEIRFTKGGRRDVYLYPPDKTKRLRSYPDLSEWLRNRAKTNQEIEYDWDILNFDRNEGETGTRTKLTRGKAEFLACVKLLTRPKFKPLSLANSLPSEYYKSQATQQERTLGLIRTVDYFSDRVESALKILKEQGVRYDRRAKAQAVLQEAASWCNGADAEPQSVATFGRLQHQLENVLQELVNVRMIGFNQSEETAKHFFDGPDDDVRYSSQSSSDEAMPAATASPEKEPKRKRKTEAKRTHVKTQVISSLGFY